MTSRAETETDAANGALDRIGQPPIADIDTGTDKPARVCRRNFGSARDELLREKDWNFATAWATPAADVTVSAGPLKKRFPLPADCIKVRFVTDLSTDEWAIESAVVTVAGAAVEQVVLVTNTAAPNVCYTRRVASVALWDPLFLAGFELRLGERIAPHLSRETASGPTLAAAGDEKVDRAARVDAREQAPKTISRETSWITARR